MKLRLATWSRWHRLLVGDTTSTQAGLGPRLLWMLALWLGSVALLTGVALVIRLALRQA